MLAGIAENIFNGKLLSKFWHLTQKEVKELSDIVYKKIEMPRYFFSFLIQTRFLKG